MTPFTKLRFAVLPLLVIAGHALAAQEESTSPVAIASQSAPVADSALVERNNFDLLVRLDQADFAATLRTSDDWNEASNARANRIRSDIAACADYAPCRVGALLWSNDEVEAAQIAIQTALDHAGQLAILSAQMRQSGVYARYAQMSDENLIKAAWRDVTAGHNRILRVYGLGEAPLYPRIDSMIFDPTGDLWPGVMIEATNHLLVDTAENGAASPRDDLAHKFALRLLHLNERENAGFFPDLHTRHNATAVARVRQTDWDKYPYSVILVLGDGPDRPDQLVGTYGKMRLARAARLYRQGNAPFLVVSGGNVHPTLTPFNEAVEMKRELMQRHGIPEGAILIEPHARHTTTNFRNTARLMMRYGFPLDQPAMATTSEGHSLYAGGERLDQKAMDEISFVPRKVLRRLSPYEVAFLPDPRSTHRDNIDPLDP